MFTICWLCDLTVYKTEQRTIASLWCYNPPHVVNNDLMMSWINSYHMHFTRIYSYSSELTSHVVCNIFAIVCEEIYQMIMCLCKSRNILLIGIECVSSVYVDHVMFMCLWVYYYHVDVFVKWEIAWYTCIRNFTWLYDTVNASVFTLIQWSSLITFSQKLTNYRNYGTLPCCGVEVVESAHKMRNEAWPHIMSLNIRHSFRWTNNNIKQDNNAE